MKLKKYRVRNIKEAMEKIKVDLGEDAFILSTKEISERGEKWLEVVAAVEKEAVSPPFRTSPEVLKIADKKDSLSEIKALLEKIRYSDEIEPLKKELSELKKLFIETISKKESEIKFNGYFYKVYTFLIEKEIPSWLAEKIVKILEYQVPLNKHNDYEYLISYLEKIILSSIKVEKKDFSGKKVIAMIGPTGSGKTTTIAKLSALYYLGEKKRVALLSIDSYRIGAPEQLKTYASILGIPFLLARDPDEFQSMLNRLSDYDYIFVDTTGRSPKDKNEIRKMGDFLMKSSIYRILLLPSTTKNSDLEKAYESFGELSPNSLVFTKIDETQTYGNILNIMVKSDLPVSFITFGQRVPEDIERAVPGKIVNLVLRGEL